MEGSFLALLSFVLATTFSPGPNNIASASLGLSGGYRTALPFIAGVATGFFLLMLATGLFSASVLAAVPELQPVLRIAGSLYIAWLALHNLKSSLRELRQDATGLGFAKGFLLQPLNPKALVYGVTVYSTFLHPATAAPLLLALSAAAFAALTFVATSSWAVGAAALSWALRRAWAVSALNVVLSLLLLYVAAEMSGLMALTAG